jgi:hypothetical protein
MGVKETVDGQMALIVTKISEAFYTATATPPSSREAWNTPQPIRLKQLYERLLELGLHQVDVGDAINDADREWFRQMLEIRRKPAPGDMVTLSEIPSGLLDDLPEEDQRAISEIVGKPVRLNEYDHAGRAELEFVDGEGVLHFIYVSPDIISIA